MAVSERELNKEKKYLDNVIRIFDKNYKDKIDSFSKVEDRAGKLKKYLQENKSIMDSGEQASVMSEINNIVDSGNTILGKHVLLRKVKNSPYFSRIDFNDFNYNELLKIYIGLTSIYEDSGKVLVYDWRSPVSSIYYEEGLGEASYDSPDGRVFGEIILKRQYKIENRVLKFIFDNNLNIDDELLKDALVKNSSAKMKNIVNSIQQEQNKIIRNAQDEVLVIDGPAGSGKTSVALHRIAFLLYRERKNLKAENIIILSPNKVFSEYISSVLPELGEDDVKYLTFGEHFMDGIERKRSYQTFSDYIKSIYESAQGIANDCYKIKAGNTIKQIIDEYMSTISKDYHYKDIYYENNIIIEKNELKDLFSNKLKHLKLRKRVDSIIDIATNKAYECLSMYDRAVTKKNKIKKEIIKQLKYNVEPNFLYKKMFDNVGLIKRHIDNKIIKSSAKNICSHIKKGMNMDHILYDDIVCINYIKTFVDYMESEDYVKQVIIDEAQDYNIMQYNILKEAFPAARFTILGDVNQSINPFVEYENFNEILSIFHKFKARPYSLVNCYRNSYEISKFANSLLKIKNVNSMNRKSGLPKIYNIKDNKLYIQLIKRTIEGFDGKYKQIGVICKTNPQAKAMSEELKAIGLRAHFVDFNEGDFRDGISVISSYASKGLEFDAVICICENDDYIKETEKKLLYVVLTRALHELIIINKSILGDCFSGISDNLYDRIDIK